MNSAVRAVGARVAAPLLAAFDRRLAKFAGELEQQMSSVAAEQERRIDAIATGVDVNLRVVSEHLLAIERVTRSLTELAVALGCHLRDGSTFLVVPPGSEAPVPEGFVVVETARCADATVLRLAPSS